MTTATVADPVTDRLAILERSLTKLKKKVRRLERTAEPPIEITPELAAEIDRLEAEAIANPHAGIPWETVYRETITRLQTK